MRACPDRGASPAVGRRTTAIRGLGLLVALVYGFCTSPLQAQETSADLVNYAYATVFGTGIYRVEDSQATVFKVPLTYRLREMRSLREPGIEILVPVTIGYYDFDLNRIIDGELPKDVATISVVPGISAEYPLTERWRVKPYVQLGPGVSYPSGRRAWIYIAGVSSLYRIPTQSDMTLSLGNSIYYAGYDPDESRAEGLATMATSVDAVFPRRFEVKGHGLRPGAFATWYTYFNELTFDQGEGAAARIDNEYEVGLTLNAETPVSIFGLQASRLGFAYRYSDDLEAWRFVGEFPF